MNILFLFILFPSFFYCKPLVFCFNFDVTYLAYSSLIFSFFSPCSEGYLISFLSSALVDLFACFSIFLPLLLLGTLYPRSNQDVSAAVLGYLLTVLFEKKGGAEPGLSIFCLS